MGFFDDVKDFFGGGKAETAKTGVSQAAARAAAPTADPNVARAKQDRDLAAQQLDKAEARLAEAVNASRAKQNARYDQELGAATQAYNIAHQKANNLQLHPEYGPDKIAAIQAERDQTKAKLDVVRDKSAWWAQNPPDAHVNPIYKEDVASARAALSRCEQTYNQAMNSAQSRAR